MTSCAPLRFDRPTKVSQRSDAIAPMRAESPYASRTLTPLDPSVGNRGSTAGVAGTLMLPDRSRDASFCESWSDAPIGVFCGSDSVVARLVLNHSAHLDANRS